MVKRTKMNIAIYMGILVIDRVDREKEKERKKKRENQKERKIEIDK